jgi:hypothetical protein
MEREWEKDAFSVLSLGSRIGPLGTRLGPVVPGMLLVRMIARILIA